MTEKEKNKKIEYNIDRQTLNSIEKLCKWSKFVSIATIAIGSISSLSIIFLSIPTVIIGIITIIMGSKLLIASNHLKYVLDSKDTDSIFIVIDQLRQYFTFNGILIIISMVFFILLGIIMIVFAGAILELFNESAFDYSISTFTLNTKTIFI